ncbi:MAG: pseudouridine synthase, partial [Armatimonadota bacterium]|nr:pseudouridine synthase [Armatimonadota bacterium]
MEERLQKILAGAGIASRRHSERLIAEGRVAVDGQVVTEMGTKVDPERHTITVDGRPVVAPKHVYLLLNKPRGYVTTRWDPHAARTVMELVRDVPVPVHPVGRLDKDTEGLLLLTNDGEFTHLLTHPRHQVPKVYVAHVKGYPDEEALQRLRTGVRLEGELTAPARVRVLFANETRAVLE